jgi:hypothetical protein
MTRLIIWGAGELGRRVAACWLQTDPAAIGYTKTIDRHAALKNLGVEPRTGSPAGALQANDTLLLAIPGHTNQQQAVEQLIAQNTPAPARGVLISVTGYHGSRPGLIREDSPVGEGSRPASIRQAEQTFLRWAGRGGVILRLGGLYCDGRGPFSALARRGKVSRSAPPDKTMALLHYDDAATAVCAALRHPAPEQVYLAVTPPCPTRQEFYHAACRKLGLAEPAYDPPLGLPPTEYDVTRLRRDLLPHPAFPDWRSALVFTQS